MVSAEDIGQYTFLQTSKIRNSVITKTGGIKYWSAHRKISLENQGSDFNVSLMETALQLRRLLPIFRKNLLPPYLGPKPLEKKAAGSSEMLIIVH
jgi:hypothetical protein